MYPVPRYLFLFPTHIRAKRQRPIALPFSQRPWGNGKASAPCDKVSIQCTFAETQLQETIQLQGVVQEIGNALDDM
jgi:hypothetical protein